MGLSHEEVASALEATGDFRVLRRLPARTFKPAFIPGARLALYVDVETTGLDPRQDEIIELAMVPFWYDPNGQVLGCSAPFQAFNEPRLTITAEIQALTGIINEMVTGQRIDPAAVLSVVSPAALGVAHNAGFDRRFLERLDGVFTTKAWACSMSQVDWAADGHEGTKLGYLAQGCGFFYDRHRAVNDCFAAIELLARPLRRASRPAMAELLERARAPSWLIWAENSPFDLKDRLKARGYRWNGEGGPSPRAWYVDVEEPALQSELTFLKTEIYQREIDLLTRRIDAHDRFSDRC
ncbi:3'-5' exonuclease [Brevundimonas nasdae]|uniref:3'-5' exonuclease n=1 Tax=Brevundimonas nasdae TaxID=172043 RepID=UPI00289A0498|nr:3'-5' exonuclease [Brevundimonas nasdae]